MVQYSPTTRRVVPLTPVRYIVLSTLDPNSTNSHDPSRLTASMSLVVPEAHVQFQHILRLLNTNVDGKRKIMVRPPSPPFSAAVYSRED